MATPAVEILALITGRWEVSGALLEILPLDGSKEGSVKFLE